MSPQAASLRVRIRVIWLGLGNQPDAPKSGLSLPAQRVRVPRIGGYNYPLAGRQSRPGLPGPESLLLSERWAGLSCPFGLARASARPGLGRAHPLPVMITGPVPSWQLTWPSLQQ